MIHNIAKRLQKILILLSLSLGFNHCRSLKKCSKETNNNVEVLRSIFKTNPEIKIAVISPSNSSNPMVIKDLKRYCPNLVVPSDIYKYKRKRYKYLKYANPKEYITKNFIDIVMNDDFTVIAPVRGGSGAVRLIEGIEKVINTAPKEKLLIGYSDITILNLYVIKKWNWHPVHGPMLFEYLLEDKNPDNLKKLLDIIINGKRCPIEELTPLNDKALSIKGLSGKVTGGNMTLIETSLGVPQYQIDTKDRIIIIEDIGEMPDCFIETMEHFRNAGVFAEAKAVIFGEFNSKSKYLEDAIKEYSAKYIDIPVYKTENFGHGYNNFPIQLNTEYEIVPESEESYKLRPVEEISEDATASISLKLLISELKGLTVSVICPSNRPVYKIYNLINSSDLDTNIHFDTFEHGKLGEFPYLSRSENSAYRAKHCFDAFKDPKSNIVMSLNPGSGVIDLFEHFKDMDPPTKEKFFIASGDLSLLNLYLIYKFNWKPINGSVLNSAIDDKNNIDNLKGIISIVKNNKRPTIDSIIPVNDHAKQLDSIKAKVTGANIRSIVLSLGQDLNS